MDDLYKKYVDLLIENGVNVGEVPEIMVLDNKKDRKVIDDAVKQHFQPLGSINNSHVDTFVELNETADSLDLDVLIIYANKTGKSFYFHSKIDSERAKGILKPLNHGEEVHLYVKSTGKGYQEAIDKLRERLPLKSIEEVSDSSKSQEKPGLETWYTKGDLHCIDYRVHMEQGIDTIPVSAIVKKTGQLKKEGLVDDDKNRLYLSKENQDQSTGLERADSMMSIMFMAASKDDIITISCRNKEAAEALYKEIKNMHYNA